MLLFFLFGGIYHDPMSCTILATATKSNSKRYSFTLLIAITELQDDQNLVDAKPVLRALMLGAQLAHREKFFKSKTKINNFCNFNSSVVSRIRV